MFRLDVEFSRRALAIGFSWQDLELDIYILVVSDDKQSRASFSRQQTQLLIMASSDQVRREYQ